LLIPKYIRIVNKVGIGGIYKFYKEEFEEAIKEAGVDELFTRNTIIAMIYIISFLTAVKRGNTCIGYAHIYFCTFNFYFYSIQFNSSYENRMLY
jgi:hypothetical protein